MAGVNDGDQGAVKPFRMKGETSRISWIMVARSDDNTNKEEPDSKNPTEQKPLVNLRAVEYRGTLNIGWIPDHGVEFFTLFIADLHEKWRKNLEDARIHQAVNVSSIRPSVRPCWEKKNRTPTYLPAAVNRSTENSSAAEAKTDSSSEPSSRMPSSGASSTCCSRNTSPARAAWSRITAKRACCTTR